MADAVSYAIAYQPPPYGEIAPAETCQHDPAGHRMALGLRLESTKKGKQRKIVTDGWFCMKCGDGDHTDAENWIDLWWLAHEELKGKCPQFDLRLVELAEDWVGGDFHAFMNASVTLWSQRQADAIGRASRDDPPKEPSDG